MTNALIAAVAVALMAIGSALAITGGPPLSGPIQSQRAWSAP